jgi:hypothetical protein
LPPYSNNNLVISVHVGLFPLIMTPLFRTQTLVFQPQHYPGVYLCTPLKPTIYLNTTAYAKMFMNKNCSEIPVANIIPREKILLGPDRKIF